MKLSRPGCRRGVASVEFAVVLTLLVPLLLGLWEVGRLVHAKQLACNAAREGGRQGSTGQKTNAEVKQDVLIYLQGAGLHNLTSLATSISDLQNSTGKLLVTINIYDVSGVLQSGMDAKDAAQNYRLEVTATFLYKDVKYSPTTQFLSLNSNIAATASWRCAKDTAISVNTTIPLQ